MAKQINPYKMSISLSVLNHLGIGLYSNIPAVLSEIVANSWDADATIVNVDIDTSNGTIIITDNGHGMSKKDINEKYLNVGYQKRKQEPGKTMMEREPMGRKGIGKLSVFSISDSVEVQSVKDGERNALVMNGSKIQEMIEDGKDHIYRPIALGPLRVGISEGTRIILKELKRNLMSTTISYLRKRLARRFSIIGVENNFRVFVNGEEITAKDRDYYDNLEFLWHFGNDSENFVRECSNLRVSTEIASIINKQKDYKLRGWIGTVDEPKKLEEQDNAIVIFAHGKLIHENLLKDYIEGGIYKSYLIGEIDADFMDLSDKEDIVTSDRQSVKENDERYQELKAFVWQAMKKIQGEWTTLRNQRGTERALKYPTVKKWYDRQIGDNRRYAEKLFGKIESLDLPSPEAKKELYKASLLAFERMALGNQLSILDSIQTEGDLEVINKVFAGIDKIEAAHYYEIVKGRLQIVRKFEQIVDADMKERVIQEHIFDHLWLLEPSWERAATDPRIEQTVSKEFNDIDARLSPDEKDGRIDIRYKTAAGKHIIIELKRYGRSVGVYLLSEQLSKYRSALEKCLRTKYPDSPVNIECISILGSAPEPQSRPEEVANVLRATNSRYITYDQLIDQTLRSYDDYIAKQKETTDLNNMLARIDEEFDEITLKGAKAPLSLPSGSLN